MYEFTNREIDVIKLIINGKTNKEIANELYISYHTVKANIEKIYEKVGIHNRILLALKIAKELNYSTEVQNYK